MRRMSEERIYLGGLDPPRLTASDVLGRLRSLNVDVKGFKKVQDDNRSYVHFTAVSKEIDSSALKIISNKYHNVRWKGCKLIVEAARPHFLQRLEDERRQKNDEQTYCSERLQNTEQKDDESRLPRRLRIRKRYGNEAYHVDTKPCVVENWPDLTRALGKMQRRREKHARLTGEDISSSQNTAFMNRAVHIRFNIDDVNIRELPKLNYMEKSNEQDESSDDSSATSSSSESLHNFSSDDIPAVREKNVYIWSDDEEESSDSEDDMKAATSTAEAPIDDGVTSKQLKSDVPATDSSKYQWSSDDASSDEGSCSNLKMHSKESNQMTNELAGIVEFNSNDQADNDDVDRTTEFAETDTADAVVESDAADLSGDVAANLAILSSIFPEVKNSKPMDQNDDSDVSIAEKESEKDLMSNSSGWGSTGLMLRYDPKDTSTQRFVIDEKSQSGDSESNSDGSDEENGECKYSDSDSSGAEDSIEDVGSDREMDARSEDKDEKASSHFYAQDRLEDVFRDARNAWDQQGNQGGDDTPSKEGLFTFGFDLGKGSENEKAKESVQNETDFSFSFNLGEDNDTIHQVESPDSSIKASEPAIDYDTKSTNLVSDKLNPEARLRRGLLFSSDVLSSYQDAFFALNDGERILEDVESYRKDESVKEQWGKERQALTLDWKRKRKSAKAHMQKRMKFR